MLSRCYSDKVHLRQPTYIECEVAKRWHNFQNFAVDVEQMVGYENLGKGWDLDKDVIYKDNVVYSRKTCVLIPHLLNNLLIKRDAARGNLPIGVCLSKMVKTKPFMAQCSVNGKNKSLGRFATIKAAFAAYKAAKEAEIKRVANLYKDQIDLRVYRALLSHVVSIND